MCRSHSFLLDEKHHRMTILLVQKVLSSSGLPLRVSTRLRTWLKQGQYLAKVRGKQESGGLAFRRVSRSRWVLTGCPAG